MQAPRTNDVTANKKVLTPGDIRKSWWIWWFGCEVSNSFERLQALSFVSQ